MPLTKVRSGGVESVATSLLTGTTLPRSISGLGTATTSLSGSMPKTLTVPSGCRNFTVAINDWSFTGSGNPDFGFHLGTGGSLTTSGYLGQIAYIYNQGSDNNDLETTKIRSVGNWGADSKHSGIAHFYLTASNTWVISAQFNVDNSGSYSSGGIVWSPTRIALGGECNIVGWVDFTSTSGVTGDSGNMTAYFY